MVPGNCVGVLSQLGGSGLRQKESSITICSMVATKTSLMKQNHFNVLVFTCNTDLSLCADLLLIFTAWMTNLLPEAGA